MRADAVGIGKAKFLSNVCNKLELIKIFCQFYNDNLIIQMDCQGLLSNIKLVRECLVISHENVLEIITDNIDIFVMILYHWNSVTTPMYSCKIYVTMSSGTYDTSSFASYPQEHKRMLFSHAFSGSM